MLFQTANEWRINRATLLLLFLLLLDGLFVGTHCLTQSGGGKLNSLFSVETDQGFPEIFQYVKELAVLAMLSSLFVRTRERGYIVWCLLFVYLFCDDSLKIHELVGRKIVRSLHFSALWGLRAQDWGELVVTMVAGVVLVAGLVLAVWRGSDNFRSFSKQLGFFLILLVFFGVGVDMFHILLKASPSAYFVAGVVEDGGEMIVMSFIVWYVAGRIMKTPGSYL